MLKTCENAVATCIANRAQSHDSNPRTRHHITTQKEIHIIPPRTIKQPYSANIRARSLVLTFSLAHSSRDLRAESVNLTYTTLLPVFGREERARACPSASTAMSTELNWWGPGSSTPARTASPQTH